MKERYIYRRGVMIRNPARKYHYIKYVKEFWYLILMCNEENCLFMLKELMLKKILSKKGPRAPGLQVLPSWIREEGGFNICSITPESQEAVSKMWTHSQGSNLTIAPRLALNYKFSKSKKHYFWKQLKNGHKLSVCLPTSISPFFAWCYYHVLGLKM